MNIPSYKWVKIGKANITSLLFDQAVETILELAKERNSHYIVTPNTDHILQLETNPELRAAYVGASLVCCDGRPVLWASQVLGTPLPTVVTGADLMPALCKKGSSQKIRIALVGGPPHTAHTAGENLTRSYPGLEVVWTHCPPLGFEKNPSQTMEIVNHLNQLSPDLVFLGVGAPKQEIWIHRNQHLLKVGVLLGIGAGIEFVAGTLPRAPRIMRRLGIEWLFRLYHDPKRLSVRYFKDLYFFVIILKQYFRKS